MVVIIFIICSLSKSGIPTEKCLNICKSISLTRTDNIAAYRDEQKQKAVTTNTQNQQQQQKWYR